MRSASVCAAALALLSCREGELPNAQEPRVDRDTAGGETVDARIECAIGGGAFERSCTIERRETGEGLILTIRNEEGGFRRLLLPRDGSGAAAADGAEPAIVTVIEDGRAEVAIGGDRYRLPAAIGTRPRPGR